MPASSIPSSRTVSVVGDRYTFVVTGEETRGAFAMMDFHVPVNHGPRPHVHSQTQTSAPHPALETANNSQKTWR